MIPDLQDSNKWEDAFIRFAFDAAVGRLFRGIIHNLNGVGQAFSMQSELLNMMFGQSEKMIAEISLATTLEEAQEKTAKLSEMLGRRAELAKHLTGEVKILLETMKRASGLAEKNNDPDGTNPFSLDSVIKTEIEFMNSDGFFKHKINKTFSLADNIGDLPTHQIEIHQILGIILENASQTLAENINKMPAPEIQIVTSTDGLNVEVSIVDNGPGVPSSDREKIFEPFFSTRKNHLGMGLYLAKVLAAKVGANLICDSSYGRTCFTLSLSSSGAQA